MLLLFLTVHRRQRSMMSRYHTSDHPLSCFISSFLRCIDLSLFTLCTTSHNAGNFLRLILGPCLVIRDNCQLSQGTIRSITPKSMKLLGLNSFYSLGRRATRSCWIIPWLHTCIRSPNGDQAIFASWTKGYVLYLLLYMSRSLFLLDEMTFVMKVNVGRFWCPFFFFSQRQDPTFTSWRKDAVRWMASSSADGNKCAAVME